MAGLSARSVTICVSLSIQYPSIKCLRSTIVERSFYIRCERLRFVPDETVREWKRNGTKPRTERSENGGFINYARKLSNALDREIG